MFLTNDHLYFKLDEEYEIISENTGTLLDRFNLIRK